MAKMIPSIISADVKSKAEKKIFKWFKEAPETEDWIVLHSLNLPEHETVLDGEADFVVITPNYGIFVLEVKGGRVKRENGIWYFTNKYGNTSSKERGPFEQAKEAINSIMKQVKKRADQLHQNVTNVFYGYGVMVPDIDYETMGVDEESWMIFDCKDGKNVKDYISRVYGGWKRRWEDTYGKLYPENCLR